MKASALLLLAVPAVQGFAPATLRRNTVAVRRGNVEMLSMPRFGRKQAQLPVAPVLSNAAPSQDVATAKPEKVMGGAPDFALLACFALWYLVSRRPQTPRLSERRHVPLLLLSPFSLSLSLSRTQPDLRARVF
jgi:hypothetical protein